MQSKGLHANLLLTVNWWGRHITQAALAAPKNLMARLILLLKTSAPKLIDLKADRTLIGREVDNDVQIDRPRISRHHAELLVEGGTIWVRDLNSSNGTFVNGRQVQRQALQHGDVLRMGDCDIRVLTRDAGFGQPSELGLIG